MQVSVCPVVFNPSVCLSCCILTWVVHPSLDDIVQSEAGWGLLISKLIVEVRGQHLGHVIVVLAEVRVLLLRLVVQLELVVCVAERHGGGFWDPASRADGMLSSDFWNSVTGLQSVGPTVGLKQGGGGFSPVNVSLVRKHQESKLPDVSLLGTQSLQLAKEGKTFCLNPEQDSHINNNNNNKNTGSRAGIPLAECLPTKFRALGLVPRKPGCGCSCL